MKIWHGYGSEHSNNLVMIGQFKDAGEAKNAMRVIEQLTTQVKDEVDAKRMEIGEHIEHYSNEMLDLLINLNIHGIGPDELQQFTYDISTKLNDDQVVVTTDELDISAFLKVLIYKGARIEVYSAHDYPEEGYGRGH